MEVFNKKSYWRRSAWVSKIINMLSNDRFDRFFSIVSCNKFLNLFDEKIWNWGNKWIWSKWSICKIFTTRKQSSFYWFWSAFDRIDIMIQLLQVFTFAIGIKSVCHIHYVLWTGSLTKIHFFKNLTRTCCMNIK